MVFKVKMNICIMILVSCCLGTDSGRITKAPRNVVALVGTTAMLECCNGVSNNSLLWRRVSLGTRESSDIYLGEGGFVDNFGAGRFNISNGNTSGCYNLIISDIQLDDAGNYACADESDLEDSASADITILESFACHEEFPNKDVYMGENGFELKPDFIQWRCSIKYVGSFIPVMQWKWENSSKTSNFKTNIANFTTNSTSTSIATIVAEKEYHRNEITCFVQSPGDEDLSRNTVNWTSKLYSINYAIFSNKAVGNCTAEELNLECNPNCSVSSVRDSNGSYVCEISYSNETKQYVGLIYEGEGEHEDVKNHYLSAVIIQQRKIKTETSTWKIAAAVVITALVVSVVYGIGILIYWLRKIRGNRRHSIELTDRMVKESNGI